MTPKQHIKHGNDYPFDAPEKWWLEESQSTPPPKPKDWAHAAARGIIASLQDRKGIKHELTTEIDDETRVEIVAEIAAIIRSGASLR
jgi:hypothetical protein